MNTLVIVLIAAVVLVCAYAGYGRWLAKTWGIDPNAKTPAVRLEDGKDYVPTNGWTVFAHQFSSIAGAGPVTGAIQAAAFGWLPVLLWVLIGGVFFGAVTDFGALYASVKNDGKSMGLLIEKYIGKTGRKLFLLFCWLFCGIVIAAFADMVAGTFNAYVTTDGVTSLSDAAVTNGSAGMVSIMFMVFAVIFGLIQKKFNFSGWKEAVIGIVFIVLSFVIGMNCPLIFGKAAWSYITFVYIFFAAVLPMWLLKQPRDYMTTFMFGAMIAGAVIGLVVAHPAMNLPVFTGFNNEKLGTMFPILFVTVACGAVSGFHGLVSSGTSSKTVENEKDMLKVGYGAMVLESLLAVLALCVAGAAAAADGTPASGTPFQIFSRGVAGFFEMFGVPVSVATVFTGPRVAERPQRVWRSLRGRHAAAAHGLCHHLHPARSALPVLRRRDRHAGLSGPLQPRVLLLGQPRRAAQAGAGAAGPAASQLRGLPHRCAAGTAGRGRRAALPACRMPFASATHFAVSVMFSGVSFTPGISGTRAMNGLPLDLSNSRFARIRALSTPVQRLCAAGSVCLMSNMIRSISRITS